MCMYMCPWQWAPLIACNYWSNIGSVHQVPITAGWHEAAWDREVFPIPLHMTSSVNQTPDRPFDLESSVPST